MATTAKPKPSGYDAAGGDEAMKTVKFGEGGECSIAVKQIRTFALWEFDTKQSDCGLCKNELQHGCLDCITSGSAGNNCPVLKGVCAHAYHQHCFDKYVASQSKGNCPACNQIWSLTEIMSQQI